MAEDKLGEFLLGELEFMLSIIEAELAEHERKIRELRGKRMVFSFKIDHTRRKLKENK